MANITDSSRSVGTLRQIDRQTHVYLYSLPFQSNELIIDLEIK
jgi:hypothetical protein